MLQFCYSPLLGHKSAAWQYWTLDWPLVKRGSSSSRAEAQLVINNTWVSFRLNQAWEWTDFFLFLHTKSVENGFRGEINIKNDRKFRPFGQLGIELGYLYVHMMFNTKLVQVSGYRWDGMKTPNFFKGIGPCHWLRTFFDATNIHGSIWRGQNKLNLFFSNSLINFWYKISRFSFLNLSC